MGRMVSLKGADAATFMEAYLEQRRLEAKHPELAVVCPTCGVGQGAECNSRRTNTPMSSFHPERSKLGIRVKVLVALRRDGALTASEVAETLWPRGNAKAIARNAARLLNRMYREGLVMHQWLPGGPEVWRSRRENPSP